MYNLRTRQPRWMYGNEIQKFPFEHRLYFSHKKQIKLLMQKKVFVWHKRPLVDNPKSYFQFPFFCFWVDNRRVIYTSVFLKNLSYYYIDTKLFDVSSILVKHVECAQVSGIIGRGVQEWNGGRNEMNWSFKNEQLRCSCHCPATRSASLSNRWPGGRI